MKTTPDTISHLLGQLEPLDVDARAMFGEYGLYCQGKIVGLVCENTVFLKPTPASDGLEEAPPYPGAKDYRMVDAETIEDPSRFQALVSETHDLLPAAKPKKKRS